MHTGTEAVGKTLELHVLLMLGSMLTIPGLRAPRARRLAPRARATSRDPPHADARHYQPAVDEPGSRIFLGFFGVRGVAAVFYAAVLVDSDALPAAQQHIVVWTTIACVMSSIIVHGLSATPVTSKLLGQRITDP